MALHKDGIEKYKASKKEFTDENNQIMVIDTSSEYILEDSDMTQVENKKLYLLSKMKAITIVIGRIRV